MTILVLGASGKTGRLVVQKLLEQKQCVRVIVRSSTNFHNLFSADLMQESLLSVKEGSILEMSDAALHEQVKGCSAVISCLGHNLTFKGIYGQPRHLVTDSVKRICEAIKYTHVNNVPVKFILMNTTGNQNTQLNEQISRPQKVVMWFIRHLIPPHVDNEMAAQYLQTHYCKTNDEIEWSVVRPDSLIDEINTSDYHIYPSPIRSAIFDSGITSRINVANFMAELATNVTLWAQWKTKMPVIYNKED